MPTGPANIWDSGASRSRSFEEMAVRKLLVATGAMLLAGCVPAGRPPEPVSAPRPQQPAGRLVTGSVSGTVAYRERMALLPDAVVEVQVLGAAGEVLGRYRQATDGLQVPIRFTVAYQAREGAPLRLTARILDGDGRALFALPAPQPVTAAPALMLQRVG